MKKTLLVLSLISATLTLGLAATVTYPTTHDYQVETWGTKPVIFIVTGDSVNVAGASGSDSLGWAYYWMHEGGTNAPIQFYTNTAIGGTTYTAYYYLTNYNYHIGQYLPLNNSATQAIVSVWAGHNDIGGGSNVAQVVANISNICYQVKTNTGAKVALWLPRKSLNYTIAQNTVQRNVQRELMKAQGSYYDWLLDSESVKVPPETGGLLYGADSNEAGDLGTVDGIHYNAWVDKKLARYFDWVLRNGQRNGAMPFTGSTWDRCRWANAAYLGGLNDPGQNSFYGTQKIRGYTYQQGVSGLFIDTVDAGFGGGLLIEDETTKNSSVALWQRNGVTHLTSMADITSSAQSDGWPDFMTYDAYATNLTLLGRVTIPTNRWPIFPASAPVGGSCLLVNSNGTLFVLTSLPNSTTWAATNKLAP